MEILIAAVVLSVGLVAAAALMGRTRAATANGVATAPAPASPARSETPRPGAPAPVAAAPAATPAHLAELAEREQRLAEREALLDSERRAVTARHDELQRA